MTEPVSFGIITYGVGTLLLTGLGYCLLPWVVRHLLTLITSAAGDVLAQESRQRCSQLVKQGREVALAGPQGALIGHLVEPHLEKFAGWVSEKLTASEARAHQPLVELYLKRIVERRFVIALVVSQTVLLFILLGFLLRGLLTHD